MLILKAAGSRIYDSNIHEIDDSLKIAKALNIS